MALQLSREMPSGTTGSYWKIGKLVLMKDDQTHCNLELYLDADARTNGKEPMMTQDFVWAGGDNPCTVAAMDVEASNPFHLVYEKIKTMTTPIDFTTATDV